MMDVMASPLRGARGNVEFLAHVRRGAPAHATASITAAIRQAAEPT
jgi:hypothetical protein